MKSSILILTFILSLFHFVNAEVTSSPWTGREPCRVVVSLDASQLKWRNSVVKIPVDFTTWLKEAGVHEVMNPYTIRLEAMDGPDQGKTLLHRYDRDTDPLDMLGVVKGTVVFVVPDPMTTKVAVYFGGKGPRPDKAPLVPLIGDGDPLRVAGDGFSDFPVPTLYPTVIDFDGDGKRDLVGSSRYLTGSHLIWYRNIGTDTEPLFSETEYYPLKTTEGKLISNQARGWMITHSILDWDGDGKKDLLVSGYCRYITFYKNVAPKDGFLFAPGKEIFDSQLLKEDGHGGPDGVTKGCFAEPCDWDGDGLVDILIGTYFTKRIYFLKNTGRLDEHRMPVLGKPIALGLDDPTVVVDARAKARCNAPAEFDVEKPIITEAYGPSCAGDWDGDGDLDIITQVPDPENPKTSLCYELYENKGDSKNPKLVKGVVLKDSKGATITEQFVHGQARMVDWNQDGKMDILATAIGHPRLYLNQGTPQKPVLTETRIPLRGLEKAKAHKAFNVPFVLDLDRDGVKDLLIGDWLGVVQFYKGLKDMNYAPMVELTSEGKIIDESGCSDRFEAHAGYAKPMFADWNGDGISDLILSSNNGIEGWAKGPLDKETGWTLKFFAGTKDPMDFKAPVEIKANDKHIMVSFRNTPAIVDLDHDGLLDLVVNVDPTGALSSMGKLMFFKNMGSKTSWKLGEGVVLKYATGEDIEVPVRSCVRFADWDKDGDFDLFISRSESFLGFYENQGSAEKPRFASGKKFEKATQRVASGHEIGLDIADLDGDGTLDLIVGSGDMFVTHYFRRSYLEKQTEGRVGPVEVKK